MAALERSAQDVPGVSVSALMARAGAAVATVARRLLGRSGGRRVVVLVGKGNNGGDGLVAARDLEGDAVVTALLVVPPASLAGDPAAHLAALRARRVRIEISSALDDTALDRTLAEADLIVDAIFGTGFRGPAAGEPARAIEAANRSGVPILAVDVPSGIDAATGRAGPPCVYAAATVTMGLPKRGLVQYPAAAHAGTVYVADIGLSTSLVDAAPIPVSLVTGAWVNRTLPVRPPDGQKGQFGRVALVAGARGFVGAAILAARGAIRAGAGLVTVGLPASLAAVPAGSLPEAMTRALPETAEGSVAARALDEILEWVSGSSVLAIGPGLTMHQEVCALVRALLPRLDRPLIADADALNALAGEPERLRAVRAPKVITPHPGEMARLLGCEIAQVQEDRVETARTAAAGFGAVVVLKGARTVVASPDGRAMIVPAGNAAMATGGMGDVLTGAAAALVASGMPAFEAAACAAYLHGRAGDLAAEAELGLLAHEVADAIPRSLRAVRDGHSDDGILAVP
jgi:NAD(P)H-hydrate epimerase